MTIKNIITVESCVSEQMSRQKQLNRELVVQKFAIKSPFV